MKTLCGRPRTLYESETVKSGSIAMTNSKSSSESINSLAFPVLSPTLIATMVRLSSAWATRCCSNTGISTRQLVHHVAQKLMTTGRPRRLLSDVSTSSKSVAIKSRARSLACTPGDASSGPGGVSSIRAGGTEPAPPLRGRSTKNNTANTAASRSTATTARTKLICTGLLMAGGLLSSVLLIQAQYWLGISSEM